MRAEKIITQVNAKARAECFKELCETIKVLKAQGADEATIVSLAFETGWCTAQTVQVVVEKIVRDRTELN